MRFASPLSALSAFPSFIQRLGRCAIPVAGLALLLLTVLATPALAASGEMAVRPMVPRASDPGFGQIPVVELGELDLATLWAEDVAREANGQPYRFAIPHPLYLTPDSAGLWETVGEEGASGATRGWRLRIRAAGAETLNLGFTEYFMPPGGSLRIYSANGLEALRPFTATDNVLGEGGAHEQLWTPVLRADDIVLELTLPEAERGRLRLELGSVQQGYRGFDGGELADRRSGSCNVDVACSEGNPYRDIIRSVARITINGAFLCSGAMVNNTAQDFRPFFLTADHCGINANNDASVVAYWLFEHSGCRAVGNAGGRGNGSLGQTLSGAVLRARYSPSDMSLIEFTRAPNSASRVFWAGWDRGGGAPPSAIGIHHPSGEEKRISFENNPLATTSYLGNSAPGNGTHLRVADWDLGTTEGGSSGSPLFNPQKRIVGQLHGGFAACGNNSADWYGRLSVSWNGGGTPSSRLRDWLDPVGTGAGSLKGGQPGQGGPSNGPNAPSSLVATPVSDSEILLEWQDNSGNETSFRIEGRQVGSNFTLIGEVAANIEDALVFMLDPDAAYQFRVRAQNGKGNSAYSNLAEATTLPANPFPSAPQNLDAKPVSHTQILLTWEDMATNETSFEVQLREVGSMNGGFDYAGSAFTTISAPGANTESLLLSGLEPDTIYNVRVQSRNANGESVFTPEVAVTTFPPIGFPGPPIPCMADGKRLCLMSDRFEVRAFWNDFRGDKQGEAGTVEGAATEKSGSFWFFKPTNTELVVKLLDGTTSTGHFWFFYGALSDVEYWMVVTDTDSGHRSTYYNKPTGICGGADLEAIPESVITAGPVEELGGEERVGRVQVVEIPAASPALRSPARATRSEAAAMTSVGERGIKSCGGDPQSLCLLDRFDVAVTWEDHRTGKTGTGTTLPALTGNQTGRFWFFNATNVELVVKMVDGRSQTGTFWFFWGALSDVIYEIKVTDTLTGEETKYTNPAGNICGGADTQTLDG